MLQAEIKRVKGNHIFSGQVQLISTIAFILSIYANLMLFMLYPFF
jgi:hypothetical protein